MVSFLRCRMNIINGEWPIVNLSAREMHNINIYLIRIKVCIHPALDDIFLFGRFI